MAKLETIELFIKDEQEDGVFAISLVESPAIEENFVALSEEPINRFHIDLKTVDDKRKVVVGYALIPEKEIYRNQNGKEFNIKFSADTVAQAAKLYMKQLNLANVTSEHEKPVQGCYVMESWITESKDHDKVNLYGVEPIVGGWAVMMALTDEEYKKAENGTYKGFSIEAMLQGFEALNEKDLTDQELIEEIKKLIK